MASTGWSRTQRDVFAFGLSTTAVEDSAMSDLIKVESRIRGSRKYRDFHPSVVRRQIAELSGRYRAAKDLEQAVRKKLHQAFGAYLDGNWQRKFKTELSGIDPTDEQSVLLGSRKLMGLHASTRERAGILADFAELVADVVPDGGMVLDIACGMNALSLPTIRRSRSFRYTGIDLHRGMLDQMTTFAETVQVEAEFLWDDVVAVPFPQADVVLALKLLSCLEHQQEGAGLDLIRRLNADQIIVSYPTRTLGGSDVGMETNYLMQIERLASEACRSLEAYTTDTEAFYVMK